MHQRYFRLALISLLLVNVVVAFVGAAGLSEKTLGTVDAEITEFMAKRNVPGLSLAMVTGGQLAYEKGYGLADVENNVPASPQTVYRLASISKMLTAVAAMQLVEQNKLDLAAPIQKYVPAFPEKQAPITCELLLKHQSGIRHYKGDEVRSAVAYKRVADALVIFQDEPLLFTPGEKYSYTTYGYNLLGVAIEAASGQEYVSYVQEHISKPTGMTTILPDNPATIIPHRAAGYRLEIFTGKLANDYMVDVSNKIPGGGWCSTPGDLARFAIALVEGRLVASGTLKKMWTLQKTSTGKKTRSGLGCFIEEVKGERRVSHSGGQPKVSTFLVFAPQQRTAVAIMCNLRSAPLKKLANDLMDQLTAEKSAAAAPAE